MKYNEGMVIQNIDIQAVFTMFSLFWIHTGDYRALPLMVTHRPARFTLVIDVGTNVARFSFNIGVGHNPLLIKLTLKTLYCIQTHTYTIKEK